MSLLSKTSASLAHIFRCAVYDKHISHGRSIALCIMHITLLLFLLSREQFFLSFLFFTYYRILDISFSEVVAH